MGQHWQIKKGWGSMATLVHVGNLRLKDKVQVGETSFSGSTMKEFKKECVKHFSTSWAAHNLLNKFGWNLLNLCFPFVI